MAHNAKLIRRRFGTVALLLAVLVVTGLLVAGLIMLPA